MLTTLHMGRGWGLQLKGYLTSRRLYFSNSFFHLQEYTEITGSMTFSSWIKFRSILNKMLKENDVWEKSYVSTLIRIIMWLFMFNLFPSSAEIKGNWGIQSSSVNLLKVGWGRVPALYSGSHIYLMPTYLLFWVIFGADQSSYSWLCGHGLTLLRRSLVVITIKSRSATCKTCTLTTLTLEFRHHLYQPRFGVKQACWSPALPLSLSCLLLTITMSHANMWGPYLSFRELYFLAKP